MHVSLQGEGAAGILMVSYLRVQQSAGRQKS
jgi:hypothetical protein